MKGKVFFGGIAACCLVGIGFLPSFFSTPTGKRVFLAVAKRTLSADLDVETLSLSWKGPQQATGITFTSSQYSLECTSISTSAPLLALLHKSPHVGDLQIVRPQVLITPHGEEPVIMQEATFDITQLPLEFTKKPLPFYGKITIEQGSLATEDSSIENISCLCIMEEQPLSVQLKAQASTNNGKARALIDANVSLAAEPSCSIQANIDHFPVAILADGVKLLNPTHAQQLELLFGSYVTLHTDTSLNASLCEIALTLQSDNLKADAKLISKQNSAQLAMPAIFRITLPLLEQNTTFTVTIEQLTIPLLEGRPLLEQLSTKGTILADTGLVKLEGQFSTDKLGDLLAVDATCSQNVVPFATLSASCRDLFQTPTLSTQVTVKDLSLAWKNALLQQYLGDTLSGSLTLNGLIDNLEGTLTCPLPSPLGSTSLNFHLQNLSDISCSLKNDIFSSTSDWNYSRDTLTLKTPLKIEGTLDKTLSPYLPVLEPFSFMAQIEPLKLSLIDPTTYPKLEAIVTCSPIHLHKELILENTKANFSLNPKQKSIDFSLYSQAQGTLLCEGTSSWDFTGYSATVQCKDLSTHILRYIPQMKYPLPSFLGDTIQAKAVLTKKDALHHLSLDATTPLLHTNMYLSLKEGTIALDKKAVIDYTLTPQTYKAILPLLPCKKPIPIHLTSDSSIAITVDSLNLPIHTSKDLPQIQARLSVPLIECKHFDSPLALKNISVEIDQNQSLDCHLKLSALQNADSPGSLDLQVRNVQRETFLQITAQNMPSLFLNLFTPYEKDLFTDLLGPTFQMQTDLSSQNGPFACSFLSSRFAFECLGQTQNGILFLKKDLSAALALTAKTSRHFLKDSSIELITSQKPITLKISSKDFSIPLIANPSHPFQAPYMQLDLGMLHLQSKKSMDILKLLRAKQTTHMDVWFAPLDMHVRRDILQLERTEILLDNLYQVALWGSIDLNRNYADLILGIPAITLRNALSIKNLPKDYVFKIPVNGPLKKLEVNTGSASAKMAALLLWNNKALEQSLGPFGGILKQIVPPPGGEGETPPPKHPFPWEAGTK